MTYYVYILRCSDGSLYTGQTNNLKERLVKHKKGVGSKYVRSRLPFELVYLQKCSNRSQALRLEDQIRKLPKKKKQALVNEKKAAGGRQ